MFSRRLSRGVPALALSALVLVAVNAGAQPGAPGTAAHIFSVPIDGPAAAALTRTDARVIARYRAFTLVRATGEDAERLSRAGADLRDGIHQVGLGGGEIDPARDRPPLAPPAGGGAALVQFIGPVKDAWLERLRSSGVRVVTYMAENAYLVTGSARELGELNEIAAKNAAFRAVVAYTAGDKLGAGVSQAGRQRLAVQTLSGDDGASARSRVAAHGRELRPNSSVGAFRTQFVELDAAQARALARDPGVVSIQPAPEPKLLDEAADQIVAGALTGSDPLVPTGPGYLAFHEALGLGAATFPFTVDVTDGGLDAGSTSTDQADLHEGGSAANPSRIGYAHDFTTDADARDCDGHGTINASIIGGFNNGTGASVEDAAGLNYGLGVAPRVRLGGSKIFRCAGDFSLDTSFTGLSRDAYDAGARISSNSWGASTFGAYTPDSQEYDAIVRDAQPLTVGNQQLVEVFAAGNDGSGANTVGSPATAKNVISVGASENVRAIGGSDGCGVSDSGADDAHDMATFSSRGPTDDSRIKPEVVGPGTHVTGSQSHASPFNGNGVCTAAFPTGSTLYSLSSGTSHSTPAVAGMVALFREWFRQKKGGAVPSPALTRAALANAATDIAGGAGAGGSLPNSSQGWGLGNLTRLLDTGPRFFWDQQATFGATGGQFQRVLTVQDPSKPVRVTLAWTDAVGPTSGNSFVNNLDLSVAAGSGTFKGNVFSGGVSVAGGTADPRNNLESVYLPSGTSGDFTLSVVAANIAGDGVPGSGDTTDQDFALVVSNAALTAPGTQPAGLVATPAPGSIALDWSDVPGAAGYELFRRAAGGGYPSAPIAAPAASEFVDSGLAARQEYCYVVRATAGSAAGPLSDEVCATVPDEPGGGGTPDPGGGTPGGGGTGSGDIEGGFAPTIDLSSLPASVRVGRTGVFHLTFRGTPGRAGSLTLRTENAVAAARRRRLVLARLSFTMPASGRARLRVRLDRRGLRLLRRVRRLPVSAKLMLGPTAAKRRLVLRAPRR